MNNPAEDRIYLYKLEELSLIGMKVEGKENNLKNYSWTITKKGKNVLQKNPELKKLLEERRIKRFYEEVIKIIDEKKK